VFFDDYENRYPVLVNQLKTFPNNTHDDGPDALSMAVFGVISFLRPDKTIILPAMNIEARVSGSILELGVCSRGPIENRLKIPFRWKSWVEVRIGDGLPSNPFSA